MKIWLKLLIGTIIGVAFALVTPARQQVAAALASASEVVTQIGRYAVFPLVFASLTMGIYSLRLDKQLLRLYKQTALYLVATTAILAFVGLGSAVLFSPRIPIITITVDAPAVPVLPGTLKQVFPGNLFAVFAGADSLLLPLVVLALILGANLTFDRVITRPIVQLADALSRTFYHLNSLIVELFWIGMVPVSASAVLQVMLTRNLEIYNELFLIIIIDSLFVLFAIYPVLLYLIDRDSNPFKVLYGAAAAALSGLVTGNEFLATGVLIKHGKENLGVPRTTGSAVFSLFAVFGRAGTALISSISFYLILNSLLPSADIDVLKVLYVLVFSVLVSLALSSVPGLGTYVSLSLLSLQFDRFWPTFGIASHYKILEPVKGVLVSLAVMLDATTAYLVAYVVARKQNQLAMKEARDFI
jgi:aerobic C4-dicarboxylate transport protein